MTRSPRRSQAGFTLIEVMIAILLSIVAVIGISGLYRVETAASADSRRKTEASVLCEDMMEQLRAEKITAGSASFSGSDEPNETAGITGLFARSWTVTVGTSYIDYSVSATWSDGLNTGSETIRSRRGLN